MDTKDDIKKNVDTIIELEKFIYNIIKEPRVAAEITADIVGVLIGLKPATMVSFGEKTYKVFEIDEFEKLLNKLELKKVFFDRCYITCGKKVKFNYYCISKKLKLAEQAHKTFIELWSTMDDKGKQLNRRKWKKATRKIGKLLGYPKTAIKHFVKEDDIENEERMKRMERNRYYAHSAKYEDKEFKMYDQKLNKAVSVLAPKTAEVFVKNEKKRWLV